MKKVRRLKFKNRTPEHKKRSYYSNFQTKPRRRRECKTDYRQRRSLLTQDKTKYNTRKYRLVVRRTNRFITAQLAYYTPSGDKILLSASSEELKKYGLDFGLKSYMAAYSLGLLFAGRFKNHFKLDESNEEEDEEEETIMPIADLGLARITVGCNVLGVIKGAIDGGVRMNYNDKRSPGSKYDEDAKEWTYDPNIWRKRCFGASTKKAKECGEEEVEKIVEKAHGMIRENPFAKNDKTSERKGSKKKRRNEKRENKKNAKDTKVKKGKTIPENVVKPLKLVEC